MVYIFVKVFYGYAIHRANAITLHMSERAQFNDEGVIENYCSFIKVECVYTARDYYEFFPLSSEIINII